MSTTTIPRTADKSAAGKHSKSWGMNFLDMALAKRKKELIALRASEKQENERLQQKATEKATADALFENFEESTAAKIAELEKQSAEALDRAAKISDRVAMLRLDIANHKSKKAEKARNIEIERQRRSKMVMQGDMVGHGRHGCRDAGTIPNSACTSWCLT